MKATELRIGNLVEYKNQYINVSGIGPFGIQSEGKEYLIIAKFSTPDIQPIPLTEKWLLKFGFEDDRDNLMILRKGVFEFYFDKVDKDGISLYEKWDGNFLCNVEYVHEFQNLYFVLTGEELVVKE
jgi:hypothetical protein